MKFNNMKKLLLNIVCIFIPSRELRHKLRQHYFPKYPIIFGRHSGWGENFYYKNNKTRIGSFVSIANNVSLGPGQHPTNWLSTHLMQYVCYKDFPKERRHELYDFDFNKPVTVGNDVWIGNNAVVQDGINLGDGCIVASNAVVTHDVPPYAIVGGVPARIIKYRFSNTIIKKLLELKWWNLPDEEIITLPFNDIDECIRKLEEIRKRIPGKE